jgi:hypothetical protein
MTDYNIDNWTTGVNSNLSSLEVGGGTVYQEPGADYIVYKIIML